MGRLLNWRDTLTFRQRTRWCNGCGIGYIVGILCIYVFPLKNVGVASVSILALTILVIVAQIFFYRCPHCNRYLGRLSPSAEFCPHCGKSFDERK